MIGALVALFFFLMKWGIIIVYYLIGFVGLPIMFKGFIDDYSVEYAIKHFFIDGYIFAFIGILVVMIILAKYFSKTKPNDNIISIFKKATFISMPITYAILLITSFIFNNSEMKEISLLQYGDEIWVSIETLFMYIAVFSVIPVLISSIIFKAFASKEDKIYFEKEQARQLEEQKKKQEIEDTNKEIEYLKKLNDLEKLMKEETINQERFDYLKSKLDKQYNKL